ncbi:cation:proton antiporter [Patescibacteria group bacterium]|nr:cation:proton antiporter [Patescibacteria group bacterium]
MDTFFEIGLILAIATAVAVVMQRLRLPLILGHILTGILVGPIAFDLLRSAQTVEVFSEFGVTALLFIVGIGLSPRVMRDVGRVALAAGIGQILFTVIFGFLLVRAFGFSLVPSAFIAVALTFSSTIIISKLLSDRNDLEKLYGRIAIGFLLVQDVAAVVILIGVTSFVDASGAPLPEALASLVAKACLMAAVLIVMALWILPRLTRLFATSQEFLFIFSIGWGVGLSALFHQLGLSAEIGALAAGVTLASSPFHHEIAAKMKMLRDFFIVMFFILLGSQLSVSGVEEVIVPALVLSFFVLVGNPLIVMAILGVMRYTRKTGFYAGLTVAQVSEFSFILLLLGVTSGLVPQAALTLLTLVAIITIAGSSLMILQADRIYAFLAPSLGLFERASAVAERRRRERVDALLVGCHRVGQDFLRTLDRMDLSTLVVDFDPVVIERLKSEGIRCRYGDAGDNEFLGDLALEKLKVVVSTVPDYDTNEFVLAKIRRVNAKAIIIALAHTSAQAKALYREGATYVIMPHYLGGNVAAMLVERLGHDPKKYAAHRARHLKHLAGR